MSPDIYLIYATVPDAGLAQEMARAVVSESLAACANILPSVTSIYQWQGRLEENAEVVMILKTTAERWPALKARLLQLHPYECPCLVACPLTDGHAPFLEWVAAGTHPSP